MPHIVSRVLVPTDIEHGEVVPQVVTFSSLSNPRRSGNRARHRQLLTSVTLDPSVRSAVTAGQTGHGGRGRLRAAVWRIPADASGLPGIATEFGCEDGRRSPPRRRWDGFEYEDDDEKDDDEDEQLVAEWGEIDVK